MAVAPLTFKCESTSLLSYVLAEVINPASFVNWLVSVGIETVEFVHSPNPLLYVKNCPSATDVIFTSAKSSIVNAPKSTLLPVDIVNTEPESDNVCESVYEVI